MDYTTVTQSLMTNYCRLFSSLKIRGAFKKVYIKQAASCFSLLIMIPFKIQNLEVLQGMLPGFHSLD